MEQVWRDATDMLAFTVWAFKVEVQAFVLMNNHYHMLIRTPECNLAEAMNYYQRELSRSIARDTHRINHIFGGPYSATLIEDERYLNAVYRYIYRNPVDAGIVSRVEEYKFSSLQILFGQERNLLPVIDPLEIHARPEVILDWMNEPFEKDQRQTIKKALRRSKFEWKAGSSRRSSWTDRTGFK